MDLWVNILNLCFPDHGKLGFSSSNSREVEVFIDCIYLNLRFPSVPNLCDFWSHKEVSQRIICIHGLTWILADRRFSYCRRTAWCRHTKNLYAPTSLKVVWAAKVFISLRSFPFPFPLTHCFRSQCPFCFGNVRIIGPCKVDLTLEILDIARGHTRRPPGLKNSALFMTVARFPLFP